MHVLHENHKGRYEDVLAGIVYQLHDRHRVLLKSLVEVEQNLLADLARREKHMFWRYKELLDELHTLYQVAAYEAGRKAGANVSTEALEDMIRILRELLTSQKKASREPWPGPSPRQP